jgi:2-dehydropantoate 2-reductase
MKVCIFGCGAVGSFIAAHLANSGRCDVSVVARGDNLKVIWQRGIHAITAKGDLHARVRAVGDPSALPPQDYVILTMKAHQLDAALEPLQTLLHEDTVVLPPTTSIPHWFFANFEGPLKNQRLGRIDPGGRQWRFIEPARVLGCLYWIPAELIAPGVVRQHGPAAAFPLGEPGGEQSERVTRLSEVMEAGGLAAPVVDDIRSEIWMKMVSSLGWSHLAVLTHASYGEIGELPEVVDLARRLMSEVDAIGEALGVAITKPLQSRMQLALDAKNFKHTMLQDLERGKPLEFQPIYDSICEVRDLAGIPTPMLDIFLPLMVLRVRAAIKDQAERGAGRVAPLLQQE